MRDVHTDNRRVQPVPKRRRLSLMSALDFKLGLRMVARYPSLTAVAVLAMAFGITLGASSFELLKSTMFPPLPYGNVGRIVAIQSVNVATTRTNTRALHDFERWRAELRTVGNVSALRVRKQTLNLDSRSALRCLKHRSARRLFVSCVAPHYSDARCFPPTKRPKLHPLSY